MKSAGSKNYQPGVCIVLSLLAILLGVTAFAGDQKLILTDGTDQRIRSYEIQGDRVRFYSLERSEMEEIPVSLVDWKATEEANRAKPPEPDLEPEDKIAPKPKQFEVAPGVALPESEGVYIYDGSSLLRIEQTQATIQNDTKRRVIGAIAPIIKGRAYVQLPGAAAKISATGPRPIFYLQLSQPSSRGYAIVRMKLKDGMRVAGEIAISPLTQNQTESQDRVPAGSEKLLVGSDSSAALIRLTPQQPLSPGEYAVVEYVEKGELNLFVWDFGYHPASAAKKPR